MKSKITKTFHRIKTHPNHWLRFSFGMTLIIGGIIGPFVPVLGVWMLPLGLILIFAKSPAYWRIRRHYVAWRKQRKKPRANNFRT